MATNRGDASRRRLHRALDHRVRTHLGLQVVAEGVEDELTKLRCDIAQGYHLSRPLAPQEFAIWLAEHDGEAAALAVAAGLPPLTPV
jgi:EAL domain-containing protein (putative c-di-GMP-specific phosphodiesterase class I)